MLKQIVVKKSIGRTFYEDHQETVWNCMRSQWLITDWMIIIMVMTVIMRMTLMITANIEKLDTLYVNNSV
jgi:hypothetical protein